MDRLDLQEEIVRAFAGVERDIEQSVHQAQLCDRGMSSNPASASEWRQAGRKDRETSWTDVPGESVDECDAALSFFTPESWRFYMPAYISRSLHHFFAPGFRTPLLASVVFSLTLLDPTDNYKLERYKSLSEAQHQAVTHFLELVEQESLALIETTNRLWSIYDDAKNALQSYWRTELR